MSIYGQSHKQPPCQPMLFGLKRIVTIFTKDPGARCQIEPVKPVGELREHASVDRHCYVHEALQRIFVIGT